MNKERRKIIARAAALLAEVASPLEQAITLLEQAAIDEREYFDNMPENLQSSERGEAASSAADELEEILSTLQDLDFDYLVARLESV